MAPDPVYSPYAALRGHMESLRGSYAVRRLPRKEKGVETPVGPYKRAFKKLASHSQKHICAHTIKNKETKNTRSIAITAHTHYIHCLVAVPGVCFHLCMRR